MSFRRRRGTASPRGTASSSPPSRIAGGSDRPPVEAVLTFASHAPICVLRVDGHEVAPSLWPTRERRITPVDLRPPIPRAVGLAAGVLGAIALVGLLVLITVRLFSGEGGASEARLTESLRALNGLFIAHYSSDFTQKVPELPLGLFGLRLDDAKAKTAVLVMAGPQEATAGEAWLVQKRLFPEVVATMKSADETFEETARREETCLGEPGAVVTGTFRDGGKPVARLWTCALVHADGGYMLVTRVAEPAAKTEESRARRIVDATELTKLGILGSPSAKPEL